MTGAARSLGEIALGELLRGYMANGKILELCLAGIDEEVTRTPLEYKLTRKTLRMLRSVVYLERAHIGRGRLWGKLPNDDCEENRDWLHSLDSELSFDYQENCANRWLMSPARKKWLQDFWQKMQEQSPVVEDVEGCRREKNWRFLHVRIGVHPLPQE